MRITSTFLIFLLAASGVNAATIETYGGDIRINRGKGFFPQTGVAELLPGDKIKVGKKSAARITYPDGCRLDIKENSVTTVSKMSPCSFKAQAGGASAGFCESMAPLDSPLGAIANPCFLAFTAAIGGGIGAAVATSSSSGGGGTSFSGVLAPASP